MTATADDHPENSDLPLKFHELGIHKGLLYSVRYWHKQNPVISISHPG